MSADATVAGEAVIEIDPENEIDAGFLEHLAERPAEIETAAPSGAASKQKAYFGDSVVAGIAEGMYVMISKDPQLSSPEVQQQP